MIIGNGIGIPFNRGGGGGGVTPHVFVLDEYPTNSFSAYSLQKLRADYSGNVIKVRRSSDNAEQDIGFTGNSLDIGSLLTFVGSGDGFVTTMYNQTTVSAQTMSQSTANSQPKIVNSGSLITDSDNGFAAIQFDGVDDHFTGASLGGPYDLDFYRVGSTTDTKFIMISGATDKFSYAIDDGSTTTTLSGNWRPTDLYVNNVLQAPSNRNGLHTAISIGTPTVVNHYNTNPNRWWVTVKIGRYWLANWEYDGLIQEFIFYNADNTDADRSAITTILMDKYVP